ncbi:hypothetical protein ACWPKS_13325 [Coraliomargarita sp. W4R72]
MKKLKKSFDLLVYSVGGLTAVVVGIYGLIAFVDSRVEIALADKSNLKKIAQAVRPSCIFDENARILYDSGASDIILDIKTEGMEVAGDDEKLPHTITVKFDRHVEQVPLLTIVDSYSAQIESERGKMHDWIFKINYIGVTHNAQNQGCRYRLELIN